MNQREAFEAWYEEHCKPGVGNWFARDADNNDEYYMSHTQTAWEAWQAALASQWQPIETAPKDGTSFLAFTAEGQCEVLWDGFRWSQVPCYSTYDGCGSAVLLCDPTHWMPLPPNP